MDADRRRLVQRTLRDHGFTPIRDTTHGTIWGRNARRDTQFVLVDRGHARSDPRGFKNLRSIMRRYGISI